MTGGIFNVTAGGTKFVRNSGETNITGGTFNMGNNTAIGGDNYGTLNIKDVTFNCSSGLGNRNQGKVYIENSNISLNYERNFIYG